MPVIQTKGAMSSQGLGEFAQQASSSAVYVEDVFSTNLYTGNGTTQAINNGIVLGNTAAWSAVKISATYNTYASSTAFDSSGNICVGGQTSEDGSTTLGLIVKTNSTGAIQWQRKLSEGNNASISAVCTDSSNNVYGGGYATDATRRYGLIVKYNSSGTLQWQRKLYQALSGIYGIYADGSGNVYIAGEADDGTRSYALLAKYNSGGTIQWQRKLYQGTGSYADDVVVDGSGNVYAVGGLNNGTTDDFFIVKYNSSGTLQWQRKLYIGNSYGAAIALDGSGNVYVTGSVTLSGTTSIITAKYNSAGTLQWQRMFTGGIGYGTAIAVDSSNYVYVYGLYASPYFEGGNLPILIKYDSSGAIQWERAFNTLTASNSVALNSSGDVAVTSYTNSPNPFVGYVTVLKQDGSTTSGTVFGVSMIAGALTDSAGTATAAAGTATDAAGTATDAAGTATDAAASTTATYSTQPAVTGKGGLVWVKSRGGGTLGAVSHILTDTARGVCSIIESNSSNSQYNFGYGVSAFGVDGFVVLDEAAGNNGVNGSPGTNYGGEYASWTFAEQPKFFDIVTYTGNGANRTIAHNLGAVPGCIMVKRTDTSGDWQVWHRSLANTQYMVLNSNAPAATGTDRWNSTGPTASVFSLGTNANVNASGGTYVAYIFGHDTSSTGMIQCGSFNSDASANALNFGWEPQWILVKSSNAAANDWLMFDTMRGWSHASGPADLYASTSAAEYFETGTENTFPTATGMGSNSWWGSGYTYTYIVIRRGPMRTPTDATKVFQPVAYTGNNTDNRLITAGILADMVWARQRTTTSVAGMVVGARLVGNPYMLTGSTAAEVSGTDGFLTPTVGYGTAFSSNVGFGIGNDISARLNVNSAAQIAEVLRRAPGFFDTVAFTATSGTNTAAHNLTVEPELVIFKYRDGAQSWWVGSKAINSGAWGANSLKLESSAAVVDEGYTWMSATSTAVQTFSTYLTSGANYVAYLFASCPGVSKVGTYTGTGATLQINCGFTAGARFVLIKRINNTGDWYVWDSARGIVAGNDPYLLLDSTAAEVTTTDWVDTYNLGFELSNAVGNNVNISSATYLYLAIA